MFLSFNENKRGMFGKRKIFGIEIPENGNGVSTVTSHGLDQLSVHSWSDAAHSEILSVSSRAKFNGNSSHNRSWTYGQLSSTALLQDHDITRGKLLGDSNSISLPSSLAEGLAQNDFLSAFNCKKPRACSPPIGFCSQNGIESKIDSEEFAHRGPKSSFKSLPWMMEAKSTIDLNADTTAADTNSNGGFSWLRATRPSNVKPNKDVEVSHEINFIDRIEMRIRDSLSTAHVDDPKHRKSDTATAIDGVNSDMTEGPLSIKCGQQCLFEGLVADTSSDHPNANAGRIDLNLCVTEKGIEDIRSTSSVRTNVRIAEIDLEMPMNSEMGTKDTLDYKSLENNLTKPSNVLHGEVDETLGLTSASVAAEALIAISSSCVSYLHQNARSDKSEVSASDSLLWFAEIVTSCRSDTENDVG
ncbi:hypothetical protein F3Y22_tig00110388pilonHSYRG00181 [Hibiscus syriacus]|uniref:Uncharacterized protein n=1 Tax=Hibiscus syriacus TaxID=106335 RepID=A0A6A3AR78_HIBSY|nr:hypothetical protein F3Y22_tig00110388pilonHSYRG00181 [Hibiscus syriacus]